MRDELGLHPVPDDEGRLPLLGEVVLPRTVRSDPALAPLSPVAQALAERAWDEPLYDPAALAANTVPVAACVYTSDMFVDTAASRRVAAATGRVVGRGGHRASPRRPAA